MKPRILRMLSGSGAVMALAGLALLGWCAVSLTRAYLYQQERAAELDREMRLRPVEAAIPVKPPGGALLGSVSIPRVGVSSVIIEGADSEELAISVGHIPGTSLPGQEGNVALAGHRDTFFRGLQNIRPGDDILLTTPHGTRLYEVDSMRVVAPKDTYVLNDAGRPQLTLVTCYPFHYVGPAPDRFIVQARMLGKPRPAAHLDSILSTTGGE